MTLASAFTLDGLMGKKVRSLKAFAGIPVGTEGTVVEVYGRGKHRGVMVEWRTTGGTLTRDGFGRDFDFDETQWLDVPEGAPE